MKTLLVQTDFTPGSDRAIRRATLLARSMNCAIILIHAIDANHSRSGIEQRKERAARLLAELAISLREIDGVRCSYQLAPNTDVDGLKAVAIQAGADALVIPGQRQSGFADMLFGSNVLWTFGQVGLPLLISGGVPASPYRRILFATDFGEASRDALRVLEDSELAASTENAAIHVFEDPAGDLIGQSFLKNAELQTLNGETQKRATTDLNQFLKSSAISFSRSLARRRDTTEAAAIVQTAEALRSDLIVMGMHNRSAFYNFLIGSVAEAVVETASCDVLLVPSPSAPC